MSVYDQLMEMQAQINSLRAQLNDIQRIDRPISVNSIEWTAYTPTISYSGGSTDPTSCTITNCRYAMIGDVVLYLGHLTFVRGSGDRTTVRIGVPKSNVGGQYAVTAVDDIVQGTLTPKGARLGTSIINVYLGGAMTRDGTLRFMSVYDIA